ncbi:MAG: response regulator [Cyclobacteriaceae bacterium]
MQIKHKLILLFSVISFLPLMIIGFISFNNGKTAIENLALNGLQAVIKSRKSEISRYLQLRQEMCRELAGNYQIRQLKSHGENDPEIVSRIQREIESIYQEVQLRHSQNPSALSSVNDVTIIGIWDRNGAIIANTNRDLLGKSMPENYLQQVKENGSYFGGYQRDPLTNESFLIFLQQIRNYEDESFAGVILSKVNTSILTEITSERDGLGETGEVLLGQKVDDQINFINDLRHIETAPSILIGSNRALPVQKSAMGDSGSGISTDYIWNEVIAVWEPIEIANWGMVAKINTTEAFAPVVDLRNNIVLLGIFLLLGNVVLSVFIARSFSNPIQKLAKTFTAITKGEKANVLTLHRNDELGLLAASANKLLWFQEGIESVNRQLRAENALAIISQNVINQIVPHLRAQVGAFYVFDTESGLLKFMAGYAIHADRYSRQEIKLGEGLAGQAALEMKTKVFENIPDDYIKINSGLGDTKPTQLIAVPFASNDSLKGVMEIASTEPFTDVQRQLLEMIVESIAIAVSRAESREKIQDLLEESQSQNEELKASEEELKRQYDELDRIQLEMQQQIDTMNEASIVSETDTDGNITFVNDKFCEISGYSREEVIGKNTRILKSGKQDNEMFATMWEAISSGEVWKGEILNRKKYGKEYYWVDTTIMPFVDIQENIIKYVAICFDITAQKEQQEVLIKQTEDLAAQSEELKVASEELEETNSELEANTQELEEKGQLLEEQMQAVTEKNADLENIKQKLEEKAHELELTGRYKSEFLANMSHELRTPLNSILLLSKLMSENNEKNLNNEQINYANVIHNSGNGLLRLINEILDLSKIESGKMDIHYETVKIANLCKTLDGIFDPLASDKDINYQCQIECDSDLQVVTDKLRLEQVLKNLLSNAIKFTSEGNVTLRIYTTTISSLKGDTPLKAGDIVAFEVNDTGIGIPEEKLDTIFEPFHQVDGSTHREYGGTGLGLSISREIAGLLGGQLSLVSTLGEGSTFTLYLPTEGSTNTYKDTSHSGTSSNDNPIPLKNEEDPYTVDTVPAEIPDDRDDIGPNDRVILIVEDDTNFAMALVKFAHKRGYKAVVSVSGATAFEYTRIYQPVGILLDIQLPVKSGWTVMKQLKEYKDTKHIPIHMMSSMEVTRKESVDLGAVDFINKPLAEKQIKKVFDKLRETADKYPKRILLIEDNEAHQLALKAFIGNGDRECLSARSSKEGMDILKKEQVDCVVLDMGLPDETGYELLEKIKKQKKFETLPVIVYTGRSLSTAEEMKIEKFASASVIKTADSYSRLMDEINLFLHLVEGDSENGKTKSRKPYIGEESLVGKKVLVVDDDVRNIFGLTKILESEKMKVISANDGKEALEVLSTNQNVDVVLMDMLMPEKDGYETMEALRQQERWEKTPIIAVTAKTMLGDRAKCIEAGASDYISKPVDKDQLISLLRVWLSKKL